MLESVAELKLKGFKVENKLLQLLKLNINVSGVVSGVVEGLAFENARSLINKLEVIIVLIIKAVIQLDLII